MSSLPAYVTVTDAAGRVLFRRPATEAEVEEAIQVAQAADSEAQAVLGRIAAEREQVLAQPPALEQVAPVVAMDVPAETELLPAYETVDTKDEDTGPPEIEDVNDFDFLSAIESEGVHDE
jgi:hypothetical protein